MYLQLFAFIRVYSRSFAFIRGYSRLFAFIAFIRVYSRSFVFIRGYSRLFVFIRGYLHSFADEINQDQILLACPKRIKVNAVGEGRALRIKQLNV